MRAPAPPVGAVVRYSYLWHREAATGQEEGRKGRPCAIVLSAQDELNNTRLYVLPITHSPPTDPAASLEIPAAVKMRLGLDGERSWVILSEANIFNWPGPDIRPVSSATAENFIYGVLPPRLFKIIQDRFIAAARANTANLVRRTE